MSTQAEWYDEAIALQQQGKTEEAVDKLQGLVKEFPDYALAHAALSVFQSALQRHEEAVHHAEKVVQLEPNDPFSFVALSLICQKAGKLPQAEQALMQAREASFRAQQDQEP